MKKGNSGMLSELKGQGFAALALVTVAILSVLGMVVLEQFRTIHNNSLSQSFSTQANATNVTVNTALTAFIGALALFGTFATVTALIIVVKAVIGVVRNMK